jgi:outer membrane protein TolC
MIRQSYKLAVCFLLILFIVQPALSADEQPDCFKNLSLEQMISYARSHSPLLEEAADKVRLAELEVRRTGVISRLLPSATLYLGTKLKPDSNSTTKQTTILRLNWDLERLLHRGRYDHKEAKLKLAQARRELQKAEVDLVREITKTYLQWKALQRKIALYEKKSESARQLLEYFEEQYHAQKITLDQLQNAKLTFYTIETERLDIEDEKPTLLQKLMELIGWDIREKR